MNVDKRKRETNMSDYSRSKVIRLKASLEELGVSDIYDVEDKYPELFTKECYTEYKKNEKPYFEIAPTEEPFIDYVLFHSYGEECGDWGNARYLSEEELNKFLPLFQQILPTVTPEQLRYVDYCFYNCTEAPDYFDEEDILKCMR